MPPTENRRDDSPPRGTGATNPGPLGVPIGVALEDGRGMLGGGGVPAYAALRIRGLGEPEIGAGLRLGEPETESTVLVGTSLGEVIFTGFEGVEEDIAVIEGKTL